MNKRIRKKKHLGEFNTIDLNVDATIKAGYEADAPGVEEWLNNFCDFLDSLGLDFAGSSNSATGEVSFGICRYNKEKFASVRATDKTTIVDWLTKTGAVYKIEYALGWGHRRKPAKHELAKHGLS